MRRQSILAVLLLSFVIFAMKKGDKQSVVVEPQEEIQETEWQIEEDDETAAGSNLFYGSSMVEGNNSLYVLDIGKYGGKPVDENERYYIYKREEGEWCTFVVDFPYGMTDINEISNLVYLDGYIYYAKKEVDVGKGGWTEEESQIYRVPEEEGYHGYGGGTLEWISLCDMNFYIYKGEIYFKYHDYRKKGRRCFYKTRLNGEGKEELYSDEQGDTSEFDYTVGGGCLYLKDGEQILGINLKTGERKGFETDAEHIDGLFYEHGGLYIYDSANGQVYQMDVRTGSESKLIEGKILLDCVWIHDGYLYYVEGRKEQEEFCCDLKAINLMTKEVLLWKTVSFDRQPCDAKLEVVEGSITANFCVKRENGTEEYKYLEKEVKEITDVVYKEGLEMPEKGTGESEEKSLVIQKGIQEGKGQVGESDETAIGDDLSWCTFSTEGNGCIYSTDPGMYDGEPPEEEGEDNYANIYRLKEGKWELFASHPATEDDYWYTEISVCNLAYYNGYLYYILLRDNEPGTGSSGKDYSICRVSEQGGAVEKLAECNGNFFIYHGGIYYDDIREGLKQYFRMKPDGSEKELIYFDNREDYEQFSYTVGGGCFYLKDGEQILEINLENGIRRLIEINITGVEEMVYEKGKLYMVCHNNTIIGQLDVTTGKVKTLIGERCVDAQIHGGYMYYVEWKEKEGEILYCFKAMNLATGESLQWDSISSEMHFSCGIEVLDNQVIFCCAFKEEDETGKEVYGEKQYFKKEISEIMELE